MSRTLIPSHTRFDGDITFALATGAVDAHLDRLRVAAAGAVIDAIRDAVA
jgi:L-aminopeptidase/D-esterase-like protein